MSGNARRIDHVEEAFPTRSPLRHLDADGVSASARRETRNREVALPPITVFRWWARRTEAVNGAIIDAAAIDNPGRRLLIADVFAGGGTIPLAAAIRGHQVYAQDLNPWAAAGLTGMLGLPPAEDIERAAERLLECVTPLLRAAYATRDSAGRTAEISHTFRVATAPCPSCRKRLRLYPHALVSLKVRRERGRSEAFLACPAGHLFEGTETGGLQACPTCSRDTDPKANYTSRRTAHCIHCGHASQLEELALDNDWKWEVVLVERSRGRKRELAIPTANEIAAASRDWSHRVSLGEIPAGQETRVLTRHGFSRWEDLYPSRQLAVLEHLLAEAAAAGGADPAITDALRLAVIGSAEMAGHLSRWDRFYLKSYESMAGHRFNFTTFTAEPNVWGASASGRGSVRRRIAAFAKAARWLEERTHHTLRVDGPHPATRRRSPMPATLDVRVVEGSSERLVLPDASVDLVLTDPPYHDDVQYGELSLPLRAWAEQSMDHLHAEALVNTASGTNAEDDDYRQLLTRIFSEARRALTPSGHLIFSYANRDPRAWLDVVRALHDAGYHGCGYSIVHSENETDVAKRGVRACTLDLIIDVCPIPTSAADRFAPPLDDSSSEADFLRIVGAAVLKIGELADADLRDLEAALHSSEFLRAPAEIGAVL